MRHYFLELDNPQEPVTDDDFREFEGINEDDKEGNTLVPTRK